jgi:CheY-like chemotaxis protein
MTTLKSIPRGQRKQNHVGAALAQSLSPSLTGLLAVGELLEQQSLGHAAREQLQAMLRAARRMENLVSEALGADASLDLGPDEAVCLRDLIDEVESGWRRRDGAGEAAVLVSCAVAPDLFVLVNRGGLKSLIDRLVEAARSKALSGVLDLHVHATTDESGAVVLQGRLGSVSDLDAEDLLRLEFCRRTARAFNGEVTHHANRGPGAHVSFTLALAAACEPATPAGDTAEDSPLPARTHLLIVDDNATNRMVAAALCGMFGCTTETAADGEEAVEAVKSRPFDLILMDIRMPRMDGVAATRAIRSLRGVPGRTPIVALTANADPQSTAGYLAAGMNGVVDKPINPAQLLAALQDALGVGAAQEERAAPAA